MAHRRPDRHDRPHPRVAAAAQERVRRGTTGSTAAVPVISYGSSMSTKPTSCTSSPSATNDKTPSEPGNDFSESGLTTPMGLSEPRRTIVMSLDIGDLPAAWPWVSAWRHLFHANCGPRARSPSDHPADTGATQEQPWNIRAARPLSAGRGQSPPGCGVRAVTARVW